MKKCLIDCSDASAGLGDIIIIMPYLEKFQQVHNMIVHFKVKRKNWASLFSKSYPNIVFITNEDYKDDYDKKIFLTHTDHTKSLQRIFAEQLGFHNAEYIRPKVDLPKTERKIKSRYVCISTHSTAQLKFWNSTKGLVDQLEPSNWNELCSILRKNGITPVCIDYHESFGVSPFYNYVPKKSVKKLGLSLEDVLGYMEHCEFFIGLSSGMAWLAHAAGKPVCMISNFTEDWYEFDLSCKDYIRITNKNVCHGCWNLVGKEYKYDNADWYWCLKHKDTDRQFECHKSISPMDVYEKIKIWI